MRSLLVDTQIPRGAEAAGECTLHLGEEAGAPPELPLLLVETPEEIAVCTGVLRFRVRRDRFTLIEQASLGRRDVTGTFLPFKELIAPGSGGDAWALLCESFPVDDQRRRIYGLGGECRASLAPDALQVTVEEAGPLRCALRCEGAFEADCPAGHYAGYRPLRFTLRIHAFAGQPFLRLGLTVVFTLNPRESEVEEIGFRLPFAPPGPHTYRIGMRRELAGALHPGDSWLVSQRDDCHAQVHRRSGERSRVVAEDPRCAGWVALEGAEAGIGVALPWMAEEHPKAFRIPGDGGAVEVYPWRHPDGRRLSLTRFSEEMHWGQGEGIYSDGTGIAKTTECWVLFYTRSEEGPGAQLRQLLEPPHLAVAVPPRADTPAERMLTGYLDWMLRHQELGRWYGFLNFGDMCATWEAETGEWRFHGRWGWCNSEWDPRHAFWEQYRRTREPRLAALAEAFTRHSTDVDTCHWHPFRPYFVGGCYRHSTDHFGDEPCASHTFPDN
ncbi:MAG: hypothetical protein FJX77_17705, partial [Armatimonadetes bacterium]|nr:hypothetical protein [Armatimonadota bacterium]